MLTKLLCVQEYLTSADCSKYSDVKPVLCLAVFDRQRFDLCRLVAPPSQCRHAKIISA